MPSHLRVSFWLGIVRWAAGTALAGFIYWEVTADHIALADGEAATTLLWIAAVLVVFAQTRALMALGSIRAWAWTRRAALALAVFVCVNITCFPFSTTFGLQGVVAYRHPETRLYFETRAKLSGRQA